MPPRIVVPASNNRQVADSPRKTMPPSAAITGTLNCTDAALVAGKPRNAVYQIA